MSLSRKATLLEPSSNVLSQILIPAMANRSGIAWNRFLHMAYSQSQVSAESNLETDSRQLQ